MKFYLQIAENGFINATIQSATAPDYSGIQLETDADPEALQGKIYFNGAFYEAKLVPDLEKEVSTEIEFNLIEPS